MAILRFLFLLRFRGSTKTKDSFLLITSIKQTYEPMDVFFLNKNVKFSKKNRLKDSKIPKTAFLAF